MVAFLEFACVFLVFPMIFDSCGLPVWVPGPPWSHPWVLDVANLVQFSKLTKLKQSKLSKHKFNNILGPRGVMRLSLDGGKSSTSTLRCLRATA